MAGGYTHITVAHLAKKQAHNILPDDMLPGGLSQWMKYVIIGTVGPDYPYLDIADPNSAQWAARMHHPLVLNVIREAIRNIRSIKNSSARAKCIAWIFGFASHCVVDGIVHPVVNLKVGPYKENKTAHRTCEMSQDVLAYSWLSEEPIGRTLEISRCVHTTSDSNDPNRFDPDICRLWKSALHKVYRTGTTSTFTINNNKSCFLLRRISKQICGTAFVDKIFGPDPDEWHRAMRRIMRVAESGDQLTPFARHVAANKGLVYPNKPDPQYIQNLEVPGGEVWNFKKIFDKAVNDLTTFWANISLALTEDTAPLDTISSWALDTGKDKNGNLVFWTKNS